MGGKRNFDALYTIDGLDRLVRAEEGTLAAGTISNRSRDEQWTLSPTGNRHANSRDLDGDGAYTSVGDQELTAHAYSNANEWTSRTIASGTGSGTSSAMHARTHDAVGNLIDDGEDYEYVYDPFGRLRFVKRTDNQAVVAEYRYNGLGFRVGWHYDVDADGTVENTSDDPWFFFAYDEGWRMVATYRSTDSSPKEQFVHHMAGLGGFGGSSYIDGVILRDRDANTAWASAADGTLEERLYYVQNWRADVVAIVTSAGKLVERVRYSAYGIPTAFPAGDTDSDGDWDAADSADIGSNYTPGSAYAVRRDADLDGDVDAADVTHASSITGGYQTLGRDVLTSHSVNNRRGYAGYEHAPDFAGADRHLFHVRHRVYDAELGRWTRRDPLGYVDGVGLYEYVSATVLIASDPWGLFGPGGGSPLPCAGGDCSRPTGPSTTPSRSIDPGQCAGGNCTVRDPDQVLPVIAQCDPYMDGSLRRIAPGMILTLPGLGGGGDGSGDDVVWFPDCKSMPRVVPPGLTYCCRTPSGGHSCIQTATVNVRTVFPTPAWPGCGNPFFCFNARTARLLSALQTFKACAGSAVTPGSQLFVCMAGCAPLLRVPGHWFAACEAACVGAFALEAGFRIGRCLKQYNQEKAAADWAYCACLARRVHCPLPADRVEWLYHNVNCASRAPGIPNTE